MKCWRCTLEGWPQLWCEHFQQGVCTNSARVCSACDLDFCSDICLMCHLCEPCQYQLDGSSAATPKSAAIWCTLPKHPHVKIGDTIKVRVALKHENSMRVPVWKNVEAIQREGLTVEVDRSCLFASDSMSVQEGPRLLLQTVQEASLVCPCCNRNQQEWDLVHIYRLHQDATLTWCYHQESA